MKKSIITAVLLFICFISSGQTLRYFEFRQPHDSNFTSFIAATSDLTVVNDVLTNIALPINDRKFISGNITSGHGGFNTDGTNWHSWHFITSDWQLTTSNVEYCDGISANIGDNPLVIAGDMFYYCPWTSYPYQEIYDPELLTDGLDFENAITIFPNLHQIKYFLIFLHQTILQ